MSEKNRHGMTIPSILLTGILLLAVPGWAATEARSGYFRTIEGHAALVQSESGSRVALETNYPLLSGDLIELAYGSRVEAVLPEGAYVRLDGDSEMSFEALALSPEQQADNTRLRLHKGEVQIVLLEDPVGPEGFSIVTANATIFLDRGGVYRIASNGTDWTEVVVRDGYAEVLTSLGSSVVRTGEATTIEGEQWPRITVAAAPAEDALESWGHELIAQAEGTQQENVDPSLAYEAAPLSQHGTWVEVGGSPAWRPYAAAGWRPFNAGWWTPTPVGLTWVSSEPWGWLTYHYGSWSLSAGYGWVWYPGSYYSPGAVYWYWGPNYAGWVPAGYYGHHYGHYPRYRYGYGFRFGIHGWAGGSLGAWASWTFCSPRHFGYRDSHRHYRTGAQITRSGSQHALARGIITTDTRVVTASRLRDNRAVMNALQESKLRGAASSRHAQTLPDVTKWVARSPRLTSEVARAMAPGQSTSLARGSSRSNRGSIASPRSISSSRSYDSSRTGVSRLGTTPSRSTAATRGARRSQPTSRSLSSARSNVASGANSPTRYSARSSRPSSRLGVEAPARSTRAPVARRPAGSRSTSNESLRSSPPAVRRVLEGVRSLRARGAPPSRSVRPSPGVRPSGTGGAASRGSLGSSVRPGRPKTSRSSSAVGRTTNSRSRASGSGSVRSGSTRSGGTRSSGARSSGKSGRGGGGG